MMKNPIRITRLALYCCLVAVAVLACSKKDERTTDEVREMLEQHKPEMMEIFKGFLAVRSDLGGRTTFEITIQPSGQVSDCKVQHSDISQPKFGEALCTKILTVDFGPKNMDAVTVMPWLDFYPI